MSLENRAVVLPLKSQRAAVRGLLLVTLALTAVLIFTPEELDLGRFWLLPRFVDLSRLSLYPKALALSYSLAVYAALACAVVTLFMVGDNAAVLASRQKISPRFRFLSNVFMVLLLIMTLLFPKSGEYGSYELALVQSRLVAVFCLLALFLLVYTTAYVCLFDLLHALKRSPENPGSIVKIP